MNFLLQPYTFHWRLNFYYIKILSTFHFCQKSGRFSIFFKYFIGYRSRRSKLSKTILKSIPTLISFFKLIFEVWTFLPQNPQIWAERSHNWKKVETSFCNWINSPSFLFPISSSVSRIDKPLFFMNFSIQPYTFNWQDLEKIHANAF